LAWWTDTCVLRGFSGGRARASAVLYSIVRSAKANGLEPYRYLRALFEQLPAIEPNNTAAIEALLPWRLAERADSENPDHTAAA